MKRVLIHNTSSCVIFDRISPVMFHIYHTRVTVYHFWMMTPILFLRNRLSLFSRNEMSKNLFIIGLLPHALFHPQIDYLSCCVLWQKIFAKSQYSIMNSVVLSPAHDASQLLGQCPVWCRACGNMITVLCLVLIDWLIDLYCKIVTLYHIL